MRPKFYLFARLESHTNFVFRRRLKITLLWVLLQAQPLIGNAWGTMTYVVISGRRNGPEVLPDPPSKGQLLEGYGKRGETGETSETGEEFFFFVFCFVFFVFPNNCILTGLIGLTGLPDHSPFQIEWRQIQGPAVTGMRAKRVRLRDRIVLESLKSVDYFPVHTFPRKLHAHLAPSSAIHHGQCRGPLVPSYSLRR